MEITPERVKELGATIRGAFTQSMPPSLLRVIESLLLGDVPEQMTADLTDNPQTWRVLALTSSRLISISVRAAEDDNRDLPTEHLSAASWPLRSVSRITLLSAAPSRRADFSSDILWWPSYDIVMTDGTRIPVPSGKVDAETFVQALIQKL